MLRNIIASAFTLGLLSLSFTCEAAGLTTTSTVKKLLVGSSIRVELDTAAGNPDGCADSGTGMYVLSYSYVRYPELYSALLAARASGDPIQLFLDQCIVDGPKTLAEIKTVIY